MEAFWGKWTNQTAQCSILSFVLRQTPNVINFSETSSRKVIRSDTPFTILIPSSGSTSTSPPSSTLTTSTNPPSKSLLGSSATTPSFNSLGANQVLFNSLLNSTWNCLDLIETLLSLTDSLEEKTKEEAKQLLGKGSEAQPEIICLACSQLSVSHKILLLLLSPLISTPSLADSTTGELLVD